MKTEESNSLPNWHPIKNYLNETIIILELISELMQTDPQQDTQKFTNIFNHLCEIDKRFHRKENQLFPFLEKNGWHGPSVGMWAFHDEIRKMLKDSRNLFETKNYSDLKTKLDLLTSEIQRLISIENNRLFPNALNLIPTAEWKEMSLGEEEIGFVSQTQYKTLHSFAQNNQANAISTNQTNISNNTISDLILELNEGRLSSEQVNLMLQFIPFDLTFVDEHDRVRFYNRGEERVFPRSAGVIGREVRFCHPPKSVDTVLRILEEFKKGNKNHAEFWIQYRSRMIHIRYFAIRNAKKEYKGVIEVSQDITEIRNLKGEQRLLDWDV